MGVAPSLHVVCVEMLAERKGREKWSTDPRNTRWSNDTSKYGFKMLQRMGWSQGAGLGASHQGSTEHVRIPLKKDSLGVGAKRGRDDDWIDQQNSFDELLQELNSHKEEHSPAPGGISTNESQPLIASATQAKKLVYSKFLRSKDLSNASSADLDCVFGRKKQRRSVQVETDPESAVEKDTPVLTHGITTVTRTVSVKEYFSAKMKSQAKEKSRNCCQKSSGRCGEGFSCDKQLKCEEDRPEVTEEEEEEERTVTVRKKRKRKRTTTN